MRSLTWVRVAVVVALLIGAAGCGDDEDEAKVPTAEELAASLVTPEDYEGEWTINEGPEDAAVPMSGVVPAELQDLLSKIHLCDQASPESKAAAQSLQWKAFRQLDLAVDDPIEPPDDREGHMVFMQEFLTSGDPEEMQATFELVREGMQACLGDFVDVEEGPGTVEELTVPDVGDERYGVHATIGEAGGWAEWLQESVIVRDGSVLMSLMVTDIRAGEGVEPYFSTDDVGAMVGIAVDKL